MKIVVVGSLNMDVVIRLSRYPEPEETVLSDSPKFIPGGKGANQAVAAARLGAQVIMIGRVGNDSHGSVLVQSLAEVGVATGHLRTVPEATGMAFCLIANDGTNRIIVSPAANSCLMPSDIDAAEDVLRNADAVLLQLEIPSETVYRAVDRAHAFGVPVFLDPAPVCALPSELFKKVDWLLPNEQEAGQMAGLEIYDVKTARIAASKLLQLGVKNVVIKMGEQGALFVHNNECRYIRAFEVNSVDSTAAGDAFCAAFAVRYLATGDVYDALRYANAAGALTVTKLGAQLSLPTSDEVSAFLASVHDTC